MNSFELNSKACALSDSRSGYSLAREVLELRAERDAGPDAHQDDIAVDRFASAMKAKLADARGKGRGGWDDPDQCSASFLADLLVGHVGKGNAGNLEDIANLAMMLHQRGDDPAEVAHAVARHEEEIAAEYVEAAIGHIESLLEAGASFDEAAETVRKKSQEAPHESP